MIKKFRFKKIDAFSSGGSAGNPAGCIYVDEEISAEEMQQIARELKGTVSEVGFVRKGEKSEDVILRYFSCEREVEFCGHATVAIMDDLVRNNWDLQKKAIIRVRINNGILKIENRLSSEGKLYIHAPSPEYPKNIPQITHTAAALGLDVSEIDQTIPLEIVHVGQNILIVPLTSMHSCIKCNPDYENLRAFALSHSIEVIHISSKECMYQDHAFRVRVFAPAFGYLEDPATGSGNAAFGHYLIRSRQWDGTPLILEQGPDTIHPNLIYLSQTSEGNMMFGGGGAVRFEGTYHLHTP